jgi:endonuclease/exonuclease/phosphatase family metal-dependent hydrolase
MKLISVFRQTSLLVSLTLVASFTVRLYAADTKAVTDLCVMTYNLRYASQTTPNSWPERRPVMRDCILQVEPDLIGSQEGVYTQLKDLASDLSQYEWLGLGRDGGSRGEFLAVFYKRDRFEPLEYDHFWLSDTPSVIASTTWGNSNRRMVTWVRFREKPSGAEFYFWNTHFDHQIQPAREKSAALVLERVKALNTKLPVLLVGDFNATAGANRAYSILVNEDGFIDSWDGARERVGEGLNTFNGFRAGPHTGGSRIDWILFRGPVEVNKIQIVDFQNSGQYPSDHFPVVVWMKLNGP